MSASIRFITAPCSLGFVLVAAGERGICQLRLGSDPRELARDLCSVLPAASPAGEGDPLAAWLVEVVRRIDDWGGHGAPPKLPLELRGTSFQQRVWDRLQRIAEGEVCTYGELAGSLGRPQGARAVASACARNPVAVLVPCHRVVPRSGGSGGYRWGTWRKRMLLQRERQRASRVRPPTGSSDGPSGARTVPPPLFEARSESEGEKSDSVRRSRIGTGGMRCDVGVRVQETGLE